MPRTNGVLMPGGFRPIDGSGVTQPLYLTPDDLMTHAVVLGMTGSGKTGLLMVLVEEAVRSSIPVLVIDIKGDLPNLPLTFPALSAREFEPWLDVAAARRSGQTVAEAAEATAADWRKKLADWRLGPADVAQLRAAAASHRPRRRPDSQSRSRRAVGLCRAPAPRRKACRRDRPARRSSDAAAGGDRSDEHRRLSAEAREDLAGESIERAACVANVRIVAQGLAARRCAMAGSP